MFVMVFGNVMAQKDTLFLDLDTSKIGERNYEKILWESSINYKNRYTKVSYKSVNYQDSLIMRHRDESYLIVYKNGEKFLEGNLINGRLIGVVLVYKNNRIASMRYFAETAFDENCIDHSGHVDGSVPAGCWEFYNKNGKVKRYRYYYIDSESLVLKSKTSRKRCHCGDQIIPYSPSQAHSQH